MSIKNDRWIRYMSERYGMISPYVDKMVSGNIISYGPSSFGYDVRAGLTWKLFTDVRGAQCVDPKQHDPSAFYSVEVVEGAPVIIPPNSYALTHSIEAIKMPRNVTALCVGKSTYARCGIHVNVTPLEAGWAGQVTIEISNGTRLPVKVYAGEGIMQVLFFEGEDPSVSYADRSGKYQGQFGVTHARMHEKRTLEDPAARAKRLYEEKYAVANGRPRTLDDIARKVEEAVKEAGKKPKRRTPERDGRSG